MLYGAEAFPDQCGVSEAAIV